MLGKHVFLWIAITFGLMVAIPIVSSPEAMWGNVKSELRMMESAFGTRDAVRIAERATGVYQSLFIDTGLIESTRGAYVSDQERSLGEAVTGGAGRALYGVTNNYLDTFSALTYVVTLRFFILVSWAPFVLPFLLGALGEGIARRKIKYATFGQYGVAVYAGAMHMSVLILVLPALYLIAPFPFTPYFVPFWALLSALPIIVTLANASQILPR